MKATIKPGQLYKLNDQAFIWNVSPHKEIFLHDYLECLAKHSILLVLKYYPNNGDILLLYNNKLYLKKISNLFLL